MRTRALATFALLSLPAIVSAQIVTRRPSTRTPVEPAAMPPAIPVVGRDLAYKRARWALEAYTLFSVIQAPSAGGTAVSSALGAGTHGDYRLTNVLAGTVDLTYSPLGSGVSYNTAEVGSRFSLPQSEATTRPFFDVRATYMSMFNMYDLNFATGGQNTTAMGGRYGRGFGGFAGVGVEHALSGAFLLTTEIAALRNRMNTYRVTGSLGSDANNYWSTTYRFTVGFRYNAQRSLHLDQNPRQ